MIVFRTGSGGDGLRLKKDIKLRNCYPHLHETRMMEDSADGGAALVDARLRHHAVIECKP